MQSRSILSAIVILGVLMCGVAFGMATLFLEPADDSSLETDISLSEDPTAMRHAAVRQIFATPGVPRQDLSPTDLVQTVGPGVVSVLVQIPAEIGSSSTAPMNVGTGTGFIITDDGYVITNAHVVDGGESFSVVLEDGSEREAELVGQDIVTDLALLQIDGPVPAVVPLGDSAALQPGQRVLAIGSPLGTFTNTVTRGIVSAVDRDIPGFGYYANLIQHDAALNPGNSGGPLFNLSGEVIGVNTLGIPQDRQGNPTQGLYFAIPSNTVKDVAASLIANGRVIYPYVGVRYVPISGEAIAQFDLRVDSGIVVLGVEPGSPAEGADLRAGDVILAVDDRAIEPGTTFIEALSQFEPGDTITVTFARGSREQTVELTLTERPE